ncbi:MAG: hypothetical protein AAB037_00460, partial [Chloroflexota bacterium]
MTSVRMMEEQRAELQMGGFRLKPVFITLTYGPGADWSPRDITGFLEAMREYMRRKGEKMVYCWVGEIQEQRASRRPGETSLHYHVMLWVPYRMMLPMPDERGWWVHGMSNIKEATHPVSYLAKYASKGGCLKWVPSGARLLGAGGLSKPRRAERAWWMCPAWVREKWGPEHRPMRVKKSSPFKVSTGGGWVSRLTGEIIPSAFRVVAHAQDWSWVKFERVEVA